MSNLEWSSIPAMVRATAERVPGHDAVVDGAKRLTFADLEQAMLQVARATIAAGVEPGDRVAIWAPNSAEWIIATLGAMAAGAVTVPVNSRFQGDEAAYVIAKSGAKLIVTVNGFLGKDYCEMLRSAAPELRQVPAIVIDGPVHPGDTSWADFLAAGDDVPAAVAEKTMTALRADDLSDVLFTSGTTGHPKGAMTTHGNNLRAFDILARGIGLTEHDRTLVVVPLFYNFGFKASFLTSAMVGAASVLHAVFEPRSVMEIVERERITFVPGPPAVPAGMLDAPDRAEFDLASLRLALTGGANVPAELVRRLRDSGLFPVVLTAYGLSEVAGAVSLSRPDDDPETIAQTAGRVLPDIEVKTIDDDGRELPVGEAGEILVRGRTVMEGYLDEPDLTASAIDAEGWVHTGDVGVLDGDRYLKITDRKKDMLIVGGFNVASAEVERVLVEHPAVAQAAVVAMPDPRLGEVAAAFVVLRPGITATPGELVAWSRTKLANYKVPRHVEVVDALPLNASMKVLKTVLRERARALVPAEA